MSMTVPLPASWNYSMVSSPSTVRRNHCARRCSRFATSFPILLLGAVCTNRQDILIDRRRVTCQVLCPRNRGKYTKGTKCSRKKGQKLPFFVFFCVPHCAFCGSSPFCWAKPLQGYKFKGSNFASKLREFRLTTQRHGLEAMK